MKNKPLLVPIILQNLLSKVTKNLKPEEFYRMQFEKQEFAGNNTYF